MYNIIYDCDNTLGIKDKDVDDGLTFLYLYGNKAVNILGVTTTHGNSTVEEVHRNTAQMFKHLNIKGIALLKGSEKGSIRISEAAIFLADTVRENKNQITILATGSLSNIFGAFLYDSKFYDNVKEIVCMGGIMETLYINGKQVEELNFSCDNEAALNVLSKAKNLTILNGHITLQAIFGEKELEYIKESDEKILNYIYNKIIPWYQLMQRKFAMEGFCNWDVAAAIFITNREQFQHKKVKIAPTFESLSTGNINLVTSRKQGNEVNMPDKIKNIEEFNTILLKNWQQVHINIDN